MSDEGQKSTIRSDIIADVKKHKSKTMSKVSKNQKTCYGTY